MPFQPSKLICPVSAKGFDPGFQIDESGLPQSVKAALGIYPNSNKPRVSQRFHML